MISCDQHDYIEIVCMYHYTITLTMKSGEVINGTALDTQRNENQDECIKIESNGIGQLVILSEIKKLEVSDNNPHVQVVVFE